MMTGPRNIALPMLNGMQMPQRTTMIATGHARFMLLGFPLMFSTVMIPSF